MGGEGVYGRGDFGGGGGGGVSAGHIHCRDRNCTDGKFTTSSKSNGPALTTLIRKSLIGKTKKETSIPNTQSDDNVSIYILYSQ